MRLLRGFAEALHLLFLDGDQVPEAHAGPLLDRIDIHIEVPRVDYNKLSSDRLGQPAREIQRGRFAAGTTSATS